MSAVFRALALWEYSTEEQARQQLVKVIERGNHPPGPYILQYAINRRKQEIQWPFLYIPAIIHLLVSINLIMEGLLSQKPWTLSVSMAVVACLLFIFRFTWFSKSSEACRFLYLAGDALSDEKLGKTEIENQQTSQGPAVAIQHGQPNIHHGGEPDLEGTNDAPRDLVKGALPTFFLHELVKKECRRPNIYDGDIHKTTLYCVQITGCRQKNILSKAKYYITRQSIDLSTPNARSTHRKYLETLLQHYNAIGDDDLYKQAENLQTFIESSSSRKN
jgi:hypothetical protein